MNEEHRQYEIRPRWLTTAQAAAMLGFGMSKTKMLIISGELRSVKDGAHRRILPEWIDEYIQMRIRQSKAA
jgi:excisionase family DNA binding protein